MWERHTQEIKRQVHLLGSGGSIGGTISGWWLFLVRSLGVSFQEGGGVCSQGHRTPGMAGEFGRWHLFVRGAEGGTVPGHSEESSKSLPCRGSHIGFSSRAS